MFKWNSFYFSLCPLLLALTLNITEPDSIILFLPFYMCWDPHDLSLPHAEQFKLSQAFLLWEMLQSSWPFIGLTPVNPCLPCTDGSRLWHKIPDVLLPVLRRGKWSPPSTFWWYSSWCNHFAMRAYCWLMASMLFTGTPRSFSAEPLLVGRWCVLVHGIVHPQGQNFTFLCQTSRGSSLHFSAASQGLFGWQHTYQMPQPFLPVSIAILTMTLPGALSAHGRTLGESMNFCISRFPNLLLLMGKNLFLNLDVSNGLRTLGFLKASFMSKDWNEVP